MSLITFPKEIVKLIAEYLDVVSKIHFKATSRRLYFIIDKKATFILKYNRFNNCEKNKQYRVTLLLIKDIHFTFLNSNRGWYSKAYPGRTFDFWITLIDHTNVLLSKTTRMSSVMRDDPFNNNKIETDSVSIDINDIDHFIYSMDYNIIDTLHFGNAVTFTYLDDNIFEYVFSCKNPTEDRRIVQSSFYLYFDKRRMTKKLVELKSFIQQYNS